MSLITFLSLYRFPDYGRLDMEIPHLDKVVHFIFYFVASILACFFIRERSAGNIPFKKALLFSALFLAIFGLIIELLQAYLILDRSGEFLDLTANLTGVLLGLLMVNALFSTKSGLKWKY